MASYGSDRNSQFIPDLSAPHSAFWKGYLSMKEPLMNKGRNRVGSKEHILFLIDM